LDGLKPARSKFVTRFPNSLKQPLLRRSFQVTQMTDQEQQQQRSAARAFGEQTFTSTSGAGGRATSVAVSSSTGQGQPHWETSTTGLFCLDHALAGEACLAPPSLLVRLTSLQALHWWV
jgi:hypothetical protein